MGWDRDEWLIFADSLHGHAARVFVVASAEQDWVLDLRMLDTLGIAPRQKLVELLLLGGHVGWVVERIGVILTFLYGLRDALDRVEKLQETELRFYVHILKILKFQIDIKRHI